MTVVERVYYQSSSDCKTKQIESAYHQLLSSDEDCYKRLGIKADNEKWKEVDFGFLRYGQAHTFVIKNSDGKFRKLKPEELDTKTLMLGIIPRYWETSPILITKIPITQSARFMVMDHLTYWIKTTGDVVRYEIMVIPK